MKNEIRWNKEQARKAIEEIDPVGTAEEVQMDRCYFQMKFRQNNPDVAIGVRSAGQIL